MRPCSNRNGRNDQCEKASGHRGLCRFPNLLDMDVVSTDTNAVILSGRVATQPEHKWEGGIDALRFLLIVRSGPQPGMVPARERRIDVLPCVYWEPFPSMAEIKAGYRLQAVGQLQRTVRTGDDGKQINGLEVNVQTMTWAPGLED